MNIEAVAAVAAGMVRLLPEPVQDDIVSLLRETTTTLNTDDTNTDSIYDEVRRDVGNPPGSFEDIVRME